MRAHSDPSQDTHLLVDGSDKYGCGITVNPRRYYQTRDRALATCPGCKESPLEEKAVAA